MNASGVIFSETFRAPGRMTLMASKAERPPSPDSRVASEAMARYADGDASAFPILYDARRRGSKAS